MSDLRLPQPGRPGPLIISRTNNIAQLYPRVVGSLFVTSYDTQDGILTRLHTGSLKKRHSLLYNGFKHVPPGT
jgi:hypothetical protein